MLTAQDRERIARATRAALRTLLGRLQAKVAELEPRPEPWPAKWTALKLSARRALEEQEAVGTPLAVIVAETARAMLAEMRRLEQEERVSHESPEASRAHWLAIMRWLQTREVMRGSQ